MRRDEKKAFDYFTKATMVGDRPLALLHLGSCYYYGQGTDIDYAKAFYYLHRAAQKGEDPLLLSECYKLGRGTQKSFEQYLFWLKKAADMSYKEAVNNINSSPELLAYLYSTEWPKNHNKLNSACKIAVVEILCICNRFSDFIPMELAQVLVQKIVLVWTEVHEKLYEEYKETLF